MYSDIVKIKSRFLRSTRIDSPDDLAHISDGLVLHDTAEKLLTQLIEDVQSGNQRAFTWTGPYGTGKSTLALYLAALLEAPASKQEDLAPARGGWAFKRILKTISAGDAGWTVLRLVGAKVDVEEHILAEFRKSFGPDLNIPENAKFADVFTSVLEHVRKTSTGFLFIIDELGRHLEHASETGGDLHCLQEVAELARQTDFPCAFLGVLHQPFHEYAARTDQNKRQEWEKIQGRFQDIVFGISVEESVSLVASAIQTPVPDQAFMELSINTCKNLAGGRLSITRQLEKSLAHCGPLHPLSVIVLCLISRQRFGQNERSLFNFLASNEPESFTTYLQTTLQSSAELYSVDRLFDYLEANLSGSILAIDGLGRRWAEVLECIIRAESLSETTTAITKVIAMLDLFGRSVNLRPTLDLIYIALPALSQKQVDDALEQLQKQSIVVYRHHMQSYTLSEGSDVDLEAELKKTRASMGGAFSDSFAEISKLRPIIANETFHRTGTLRYFEMRVQAASVIQDVGIDSAEHGFDGVFVLILPDTSEHSKILGRKKNQYSYLKKSNEEDKRPIVVGVLQNYKRLLSLVSEFFAIEQLERNLVELQTDRVARRQLSARKHETRQLLMNELEIGRDTALWEILDQDINGPIGQTQTMSQVASIVSSRCYSQAPKIHNELINRRRPSGAAAMARRLLMKAMIECPEKHKLGISKHPAELGLYFSLLEKTGLHHQAKSGNGSFSLTRPEKKGNSSQVSRDFYPLWSVADTLLKSAQKTGLPLPATEIIRRWMEPPFGLREGVIPILLLAYILSSSEDIALYVDEIFVTHLDDFVAERIAKSPKSVAFRRVHTKGLNVQVLSALAQFSTDQLNTTHVETALEVAKRLVQFSLRLPKFAKSTSTVSSQTQRMRSVLLHANDPHALLFSDLPKAAGFGDGLKSQNDISIYLSSVQMMHNELQNTYSNLLEELGDYIVSLFGEADIENGWRGVQKRAAKLKGLAGDKSLNRAFERLSGKDVYTDWVESVCSLVILKPVRDWDDDDHIVAAKLKLNELASKFKAVERFVGKTGLHNGVRYVELSTSIHNGPLNIFPYSFASLSEDSNAFKLKSDLKRKLDKSSVASEDVIAAVTMLLEDLLNVNHGGRTDLASGSPGNTEIASDEKSLN